MDSKQAPAEAAFKVPSLEVLAENDQRFRELVEALPDAILVHSENRIVYVNPFCVRLLAASGADQLLGKNVFEIIDSAHHLAIERRIRNCYSTGTASSPREFVLIACDGSRVEAEAVAIPISWKGARAIAVALRDIGRRKQTEQALRQSEEKYRKLFENATYGIFLSKLDGTFLDVNPALVTMLGYSSKEELLTRNLNTDVHEDPAVRASILARYGPGPSGRVDDVEVNWKRKDGKIVAVSTSGGAVQGEDGEFSHFEVIVEDITEKRNLEAQFRQAHKMEALGLLAGGISHDFNNLLSVILANSELLLEKMESDGQRHHGEEIIKATQRASQLTQQLLAFSRKQVIYPAVLNLNAVVYDVSKILQRLIGEDVQIVTQLETGLGAVRADRGQIEQILMNLATNARDAMPNGGKFTVLTENARLGPEDVARNSYVQPGQYVRLSASDTGTGMTEEARAHIFEPFFTTKAQGRGTGLGLATIYGIVKQSGGYIWATSAPGAGTTFDIYLPRIDEKPAPSVSSLQETRGNYPRGTETILVLEDEEALRQVTCEFLAASGYNVLQAGRGDSALDVAAQYREAIPLIVSDVVLPDMNGPAIVVKIQALHPEAKVLYVSGYTQVPLAQRLIAEGAVLLPKPFLRKDLLKRVDETLHPQLPAGSTH